jgi:hypothetical protein
MNDFQRPNNGWLCFFSLLWMVLGAGFAIHFALRGNFLGAAIMGGFGAAAAGLWFQSRLAAWIIILFACVGIIHGLLNIGHIPLLRLLSRFCWAGYSIFLLAEFLNDSKPD